MSHFSMDFSTVMSGLRICSEADSPFVFLGELPVPFLFLNFCWDVFYYLSICLSIFLPIKQTNPLFIVQKVFFPNLPFACWHC